VGLGPDRPLTDSAECAVEDTWLGAWWRRPAAGDVGRSSEGPLEEGKGMSRSLDLGRVRSLGLVQAADPVAMETGDNPGRQPRPSREEPLGRNQVTLAPVRPRSGRGQARADRIRPGPGGGR
jgi:hypothetical protein